MNIKESVNNKIADNRRDIQAAGTVVAILAAVYYLGKSRGKVSAFVCLDDYVFPTNPIK